MPAERIKVPRITPWFWTAKILSTAMGEATSDFMVVRFGPYKAVAIGFLVFALAMVWQLGIKRYAAIPYWFAVSMVAVFGTQAADVLHIEFHVPYAASTILYAAVLTAVFVVWYRTEHTLSIHSITTPRRELFYWATVLSTFALGTALGDFTAATLGLGYLASGIMFGLVILIPAIAFVAFRANAIAMFWFAYVLTRPLGASFADYMSKPAAISGANIGDAPTALLLAAPLALLILFFAVSGIDRPEPLAHRSLPD